LAKKNSIEYQDITIQESNLDWISDGIEQDLPPCIELEAEDSDLSSSFQDQGPSISQTAEMLDEQEDSIWHITWNSTAFTQTERRFYNKLLQQATKKPTIRIKKQQSIFHTLVKHLSVNTIPTADFSQKLSLALSGGRGDFHQFRDTKLTVSDWAKNLLLYEDGRFAKIKCGLSMF
jgi:hypothetical protein